MSRFDYAEYVKVSEVAKVIRGVRVVRNQLSREGKYPVYQNSMKPLGYYDKYNCHAGTVFVISAGAAGDIGYSYVDFWAADDCLYIIPDERLEDRYLYHVLLWQQYAIYSRVRRSAVPRLSKAVIEGLIIPLPPLEIQQETIRILDKWSDANNGLIAEIERELELRRQQYGYYRDKLLSFNVS